MNGLEHIPESSEPAEDLSYWQRVKRVCSAGGEEFWAGGPLRSPLRKLGLLATAGFLAYEWGPGNEAVTPIVAAHVIDNTQNLSGVIATGVISGGFTFIEQVCSGSTIAYTAAKFPKLTQNTYELFSTDDSGEAKYKPWRELSKKAQFGYSFLLGSTAVVAHDAAVMPEASQTYLTRQAVRSAAITGSTVALLGSSVDALVQGTDGTPLEPATDGFIHILENPLYVLGGVAALIGLAKLKSYVQNRRKNHDG